MANKLDDFVIDPIDNAIVKYIGNDKEVQIPNGIERIWDMAFKDAAIEQVRLPDSLKQISKGAFADCIQLKNVYFTKNSNLVYIGEGAFWGCTALEKFTSATATYTKDSIFPTKLEMIDANAFKGCSSLLCVILPNSLRSMEHSVFSHCTGLETVSWQLSKLDKIPQWTFFNCQNLKNIFLPNQIKYFGHNCFCNCYSLKKIYLPSDLEMIGDKAFRGCTMLTGVTLPPTVSSIGENAFENCDKLRYCVVSSEDPLFCIRNKAFRGCVSLERVTFNNDDQAEILDKVSDIFIDCKMLHTFKFPGFSFKRVGNAWGLEPNI